MKTLLEDIERLSQLVGVSSREQAVAADVRERFSTSGYAVKTDPIGNVILSHPGNQKGQKKILLFAHMDEIGLLVRKVEGCFLRFERLGGVNTQILPGLRVQVLDDLGQPHPGVIGVQAHHFMPADKKFTVPPLSELYIDVFAQDGDDLKRMNIGPGCYGALDGDFRIVAQEVISGKSLDNRMAMAVLYHCAEALESAKLPYNLYFCFPVMEEFNIRGLMPVLRKIRPDVSLGLDITPACDTPDLDYNDIRLGGGPALTCMNFHGGGTLAGVLPDAELASLLKTAARRLSIPLQMEIAPGVITENAFGLFENEGVKVANLSIPTRYTHTPNETARMSDIEYLEQLLNGALTDELSRWLSQ